MKDHIIAVLHFSNDNKTIAFDVFEDTFLDDNDPRVRHNEEYGYNSVECPVVKNVLKNNPSWVYLGSEDFEHHPSCNPASLYILSRCDRIIVYMGEHETD